MLPSSARAGEGIGRSNLLIIPQSRTLNTMSKIPRDFIQLLLNKVDIVDFIDARVPLRKKSSNNYFACCPFHGEKTASFSVSQNKQFYYCFGCGAHGNAIDFLIQFDRLNFPEAVEALARHAGIAVPQDTTQTEKTPVPTTAYDLLENINKYYQASLKQNSRAIEYLKHRGISGQIAKTFEIGLSPPGWDNVLNLFGKTPTSKRELTETGMLIKKEDGGYYDRFRDRIMFPIRDRRGRIVGFGGRVLDQGEPKYLNSPETPIFQKGHELYGLFQSLQAHRQLPQALIVEGYMDVIALFQFGIHYAIATLGTATTHNHLQRLIRYTPNIIFCFDGDQAGRTAAWRALLVALPLMHDDIQIRFMFLPDGEDPDSLIRKNGKDYFEQELHNAIPLSNFFFQSLSSQTDLSHMEGRARFVKLALDHINQLPDGVFKQMMLEDLTKRTGVNFQNNQPSKGIKKATRTKPLSPIRLALMLLIQQPELAFLIKDPLPPLISPGYNLLQELVEQIKNFSHQSTGAILEHWRDREEATILVKLALVEHSVPPMGIQNEFLGAIQRLRKQSKEQAIKQLLAKANQNLLTDDEKVTLTGLIHNKEY